MTKMTFHACEHLSTLPFRGRWIVLGSRYVPTVCREVSTHVALNHVDLRALAQRRHFGNIWLQKAILGGDKTVIKKWELEVSKGEEYVPLLVDPNWVSGLEQLRQQEDLKKSMRLVIPLIFPKVPQSSLPEPSGFPRNTPSPWAPPPP